jgi:predicted RNA-binding Zn ribbon-like protein
LSHYSEGTLLLAEKIANTLDTTRPEPEYLRTVADLERYLRSWNIAVSARPTEQDLADVLALRQQIRAVFTAPDLAAAAAVLNTLLDGARVHPHVALTETGSVQLQLDVETEGPLVRRLAVEAALGLSAALEHHGLDRLHLCAAAPCTEVFIDTSRNHTRRYCCTQCATRHNVAAYRERRRSG